MSTESEEQKLQDLVGALSNLTVLQMSKLKTALEDTWGVKAAAAAAVVAAPAAGQDGQEKEESTEFKVMLENAGSNKIAMIKAVRQITGVGLKEAKELVESAPAQLQASVNKEEANAAAQKIKDAGGEVKLIGL